MSATSELAEYLETLKGGIPDSLAGYDAEDVKVHEAAALVAIETFANGTPEDLAARLLLFGAQIAIKAMGV